MISRDENNWHAKGLNFITLAKYPQAIECHDKMLSFEPDYFNAWHEKGKCFEKLEQHQKAKQCFDKSKELQNNS